MLMGDVSSSIYSVAGWRPIIQRHTGAAAALASKLARFVLDAGKQLLTFGRITLDLVPFLEMGIIALGPRSHPN